MGYLLNITQHFIIHPQLCIPANNPADKKQYVDRDHQFQEEEEEEEEEEEFISKIQRFLGLLDAGADPNIIDFGKLDGSLDNGVFYREKYNIAKILITNRKYNYNVNSKSWPPIMSAITWGNLSYVQFLLLKDVGTNINFRDDQGKTPMDRAMDLLEGPDKNGIINCLNDYEKNLNLK